MSFFDALNISASGLTAERMEMDVTAENLANAQSTDNGTPYQPQAVDLEAVGSGEDSFDAELQSALQSSDTGTTGLSASADSSPGGVQVTGIVDEDVPDQLVYDPGNPDANKQGYVDEPDIQPVTEMTNLIDESNAYQANVTAMQTSKSMYSETLDLLQ